MNNVTVARQHLRPEKLLVFLCVLLIGCPATIWRSELKSPDGAWLAVAHTEQDGGFGSAVIYTLVDLESTNGTVNRGKPFNIVVFDCPGPAHHAYVLENANAGGTIDLHMQWLSPSHLEVSYDGQAKVTLQVAQFAGISISLRDTSQEVPTATR
jgi:hypothetical protein